MFLRRLLFSLFVILLTALAARPAMAQAPAPPPPGAPIVRSVEVQYAGPASVSKEKILANMRTRVGVAYSDQLVEDDIRNLYATGNIANVRIFGEPVADGVKVIVVVAAKAQVSEVVLQGPERLKPNRVRKIITSKVGDALSEATLEQDRQKVIDYYKQRGFTEAEVRYTVESNEKLGTAKVVFDITEGSKTTIREVRFEGNTAATGRQLRRVIKTKPRSIFYVFSQSGRLNNELIEQDTFAIRDYYQNRGYIDVQVETPRVERVGEKVDLTFPIVEGPQYRVGKVTFTGAKVFTAEELTRNLKVKSGDIYSPSAVRADIKGVQDTYGSRGYIDFQAGANTSAGGPQLIDLSYSVDEGVQSYLEKVNISGNSRTKDKVLRREIAITPGEIFNTVRVDASKARLQNLNYFSRVEVFPTDTGIPGRKDLNIIVEEKRTGSFNFGAGFSSIDNLLGFAEITQGNFDALRYPYFTGAGQKFRLRIQYGTRRRDFVLALTEPYFLDQRLSLGGEIFYREASFFSRNFDERRFGFDLNARKGLNDFTSVRASYRLENIGILNVDEDASQQLRDEAGERLKSQISAGITYDTRDSVFLTRKGERLDLLTYVAGGFLGGDTDIYGFDLEGSKYFHLPFDTILVVNGEIAVVNNWSGGERVPIFDRLFLGGANNLRGFNFREVGPKDDDEEPLGGKTLMRATIEYTFPVIDKVRGAIFYDVGFVSSESFKFSPQKESNGSGGLNQDFGIGVRLELPIGPVRIDYGIPITSDDFNDSGGKFNFNIGYQF